MVLDLLMIPVTDEDRTGIDIVLGVLWAVDNEGAVETTRVLGRVVGMIPGGAVQIGLEAVGEGSAWRNGTLLDGGHAVEPGSFLLEESVTCSEYRVKRKINGML